MAETTSRTSPRPPLPAGSPRSFSKLTASLPVELQPSAGESHSALWIARTWTTCSTTLVNWCCEWAVKSWLFLPIACLSTQVRPLSIVSDWSKNQTGSVRAGRHLIRSRDGRLVCWHACSHRNPCDPGNDGVIDYQARPIRLRGESRVSLPEKPLSRAVGQRQAVSKMLTSLTIAGGLVLLATGGDLLVRGSARIATRFGVSPWSLA